MTCVSLALDIFPNAVSGLKTDPPNPRPLQLIYSSQYQGFADENVTCVPSLAEVPGILISF